MSSLEKPVGKIFKTENDGIVMEFATGLIDYCEQFEYCDLCQFYAGVDECDQDKCKIGKVKYWELTKQKC